MASPYTVIGIAESRTKANESYEIRVGGDGVTYCVCPGWRFSKKRPKSCKHLDTFLALPPETSGGGIRAIAAAIVDPVVEIVRAMLRAGFPTGVPPAAATVRTMADVLRPHLAAPALAVPEPVAAPTGHIRRFTFD